MPSASHADSGMHDSVHARRGVGSRSASWSSAVLRPMWQHTGRPLAGDRRPHAVVALVEVVGLTELGGEHRELQRLAAHRRDALDLGDREVDVVDRHLVGDDEPRRIGRREVVQRVVERARRVGRAGGQQVQVPVRAHLAVEDLDVDAVDVHVAQALVRLGVAGPVPRRVTDLVAALVGLGRVAAEHLAVRLHQRGVVLVVQPSGEVGLHVVVLAR